MQIESAMQTYIGARQVNQDRMFAAVGQVNGMECGLFCVADGMGGTQDGHYAAELAVEGLLNWWESDCFEQPNFPVIFNEINEKIMAHAKVQKTTLGTTLSLLFICNGKYYITHTGDSRIYLAKKKLFCSKITTLTQDHTYGADKQRAGMPKQEISINPKKNMLTSCLGVFENPKLFTSTGTMQKNDVFLICSDGLYRVLNDKALAKTITSKKHITTLATELIQMAEKRGAKDNATAVVVRGVVG